MDLINWFAVLYGIYYGALFLILGMLVLTGFDILKDVVKNLLRNGK